MLLPGAAVLYLAQQSHCLARLHSLTCKHACIWQAPNPQVAAQKLLRLSSALNCCRVQARQGRWCALPYICMCLQQ